MSRNLLLPGFLLGILVLLAASAVRQDPQLIRHEVEGCEVIIGPVTQRGVKEPLSVWFSELEVDKGARFDLNIAKPGMVSVYDLSGGNPQPLTRQQLSLLFKYDNVAEKYDVELLADDAPMQPTPITWQDVPTYGTLDALGPFGGVGSETVRHPLASDKTAVRVWFENYGLKSGFLLAKP